ncbi:MAG: hypothetical protein CME32_22730 [Gimesia sp.]|nr:hypothetical protein [Gimesia sp.]
MKHHIVLNIGQDGYTPSVAEGEIICPFVIGTDEGGNTIRSSVDRDFRNAGLRLTPTASDILNLASAAYSADLFVRRKTGFDSWTRDLKLHLPVHDRSAWQKQSDLVIEMLSFLSGDHWELELRDRAKTDTEEAAPLDENEFSATEVSLFSGGLDSFIGSIERLAAGEHLYLVGHHGAGTTNKAQVDAFESISKHYEKQACSLRFYVQPPMPEGEAEKTTRSRSILFLALGHAVAASAEKALPLHVPENGLISLNPPLTSSRLGTLSTRTTHPHFMDLFRTLLAALGSDVEVVTPYRFETKGEMALRAFSNPAFASAVHRTVSCSHPDVGRYQGESPGQHCGYCVPCIIRRAALYAAGLDDPAHYLNDIVSTRPSAGSDTNRDLRAFEMAVARFDEADLSRHLFDVLSTGPIPPEHADEFAAVYRRGMTEVKNFLQTLART